MANSKSRSWREILIPLLLASSIALNLFFIFRSALLYGHHHLGRHRSLRWRPSWSGRAAEEAEYVAAISCSGHGRAYLDGLIITTNHTATSDDAKAKATPICECNACFGGSDCSLFLPDDCVADADGGDPYFLEPFWMQNPASSAILVAGWHRMSYNFIDKSTISEELENHIRKLHAFVGNAVTQGRFIVFGVGSTQLLNAAIRSLSSENSSSPARVVASVPYYSLYKQQTEYFQSASFEFEGEASLWRNNTSNVTELIELVTSPNNPDGEPRKAVLRGSNAKAIHDRVYYWPHFTAISTPADDDIMLFSLSKLSGHAGTRFGWAVVKDKEVFERMYWHVLLNTLGVSKDSQLRALQLIKVALDRGDGDDGLFGFGFETLSKRWERLKEAISPSKRFSVQKLEPQYCSFFNKVREPSPAYAWIKCEIEEEKDCYEVLRAADIIGRRGSRFGAEERFVRLSLVKTKDDFEILIRRLNKLAFQEYHKTEDNNMSM